MVLGSNPQRQLRFFHIFPLLFFQTPLDGKVSEGSELGNCFSLFYNWTAYAYFKLVRHLYCTYAKYDNTVHYKIFDFL